MAEPTDDELREDIVALLSAKIRAGFQPRDEIWLDADDICEQSTNPDALRQFASAMLERLWKEQRTEEASWVGRTDCDRLDEAFAELESTGVVCRQDFTCCGNCGVAEIGDEFAAVEDKHGVSVRGYAFYHMQDTESAVEGRGLYLNYGAEERSETAALAIAREIIAVLKSHGLKPDWDGRYSQRIHVPLEWRRRLSCA